MKNVTLLLIFLNFTNVLGQTYRNAYDNLEKYSYAGQGASFRSNGENTNEFINLSDSVKKREGEKMWIAYFGYKIGVNNFFKDNLIYSSKFDNSSTSTTATKTQINLMNEYSIGSQRISAKNKTSIFYGIEISYSYQKGMITEIMNKTMKETTTLPVQIYYVITYDYEKKNIVINILKLKVPLGIGYRLLNRSKLKLVSNIGILPTINNIHIDAGNFSNNYNALSFLIILAWLFS